MSDKQDPRLGRWPVSITIPVAWGEMDALGHVNNAVYLRYMESARIAYFERLGIKVEGIGEGPIIASLTVHYRKAVVYPDTLTVAVSVTRLGTTSFVNGYRMTNHRGEVVCEGESIGVWFDYKAGGKVALSEKMRNAIYAVEATATTVT